MTWLKSFFKRYLSVTAERVRDIAIIGIAFLALLMLLLSESTSIKNNTRLKTGNITQYSSGWEYFDGKELVPIKDRLFNANGANTLIIYHQLPQYSKPQTLVFKNEYQSISVAVTGSTIYTYDYLEEKENIRYISNFYCFAEVPVIFSGQTIAVSLKTSDSHFIIPDFELCDNEMVLYRLISKNIFTVFISAVGLFIGTVLVIVMLLRRKQDSGYILYLSCFLLLSSVWMLTRSGLTQVFFDMALANALLYYFSFMMMPVPLLIFINKLTSSYQLPCRIVSDLAILNTIVCTLLQAFGLCNFRHTMVMSATLMIITVVLALFVLFMSRKRSALTRAVFYALSFLCVTTVIDMITYYIKNSVINGSLVFGIGFFVFFTTLATLLVIRSVSMYDINNKAEKYMNLALWDSMTKLGNRTAFNEAIEKIEFKENETVNVGIIIVDLNNLKIANDFYGHTVGDELLCSTAECMRKAYEGIGSCYRIGGDEFAALFINKLINMQDMEQRLDEYIERQNINAVHKINLAKGSSMGMLTEDNKKDNAQFRALFKIADDSMYKDKIMAHEMSGTPLR